MEQSFTVLLFFISTGVAIPLIAMLWLSAYSILIDIRRSK